MNALQFTLLFAVLFLTNAGNVKKPIGFSELRTDLQCFSKSNGHNKPVYTSGRKLMKTKQLHKYLRTNKYLKKYNRVIFKSRRVAQEI